MKIMVPLGVELSLIKEKFPQQASRIEQLYGTDKDFQSLCLDYSLSIKALQKLGKDFNEKINAIIEYQNIIDDLEKELIQYIMSKH
jgi:hypothetical protein